MSRETNCWLCLPFSVSAPSVARAKESTLPWEHTFGRILRSPTASVCGCVHACVMASVAVPQGASIILAWPSCSAFTAWAPPTLPSLAPLECLRLPLTAPICAFYAICLYRAHFTSLIFMCTHALLSATS